MLAKFEALLNSKASSTRVDGLVTDTNACYDKSAEACCAVEQLVTLGSILKVVALEHELWDMGARTRILESTLDRASRLMEDLSTYVADLAAGFGSGVPTPGVGVAAAYFLTFKATQEQAVASIRQELKGGDYAGGGRVRWEGCMHCLCKGTPHWGPHLPLHPLAHVRPLYAFRGGRV